MDNKKVQGKQIWTVNVGSKGQIVIPKEARELFNIMPGDSLVIIGERNRGLTIPVKETVKKRFDRFSKGNKV
ncbi:MAG: AbrB/MazE/SpoVT family DNA-binding domain-containing protein [Erysipelotrichaceae bacterium]|nr:AbrB/MazE/SpoVT family DNA-binding domain-containing protein [Erysipelotrichaceae bacterium]